MKYLLLIAVLLSGCAGQSVNEYGDTAYEAKVRAWLTEQVSIIHQKKRNAGQMLLDGEITGYEHFQILQALDVEMRSLPSRVPDNL